MLFRVIEVRLHPDRAPDFKRRVKFTDSARILIEAGEELLEMDAEDVRTTHVCGILARLDRHPLYHTEFLRQYRELSGCPGMVLKANIQPEIDRLIAYLPDKPYSFSSDPQGVHGRLLEFSSCGNTIRTASDCLHCWPPSSCGSTATMRSWSGRAAWAHTPGRR